MSGNSYQFQVSKTSKVSLQLSGTNPDLGCQGMVGSSTQPVLHQGQQRLFVRQ